MRDGVVPEEEEKKKRGRKRIEEKWTRVLAIESDPLKRVTLPTIAAELQLAQVQLD